MIVDDDSVEMLGIGPCGNDESPVNTHAGVDFDGIGDELNQNPKPTSRTRVKDEMSLSKNMWTGKCQIIFEGQSCIFD